MKKIIFIFSFCLFYMQAIAQTGTTTLVSVGADGKLKYTPDAKGNIIPDFSAVGYRNGDVDIPNVAIVRTINSVAGDNTANIQNAINAIASLPLDANGIRGALLLKAGIYNINNTINVRSSGIIIRGEGNATVLMATRTSQYNLINISGSGGATPVTSTSKKIQGAYIPVGTKTFTLLSGHGFVSGDDIMLQRKPNQAWINMLGMNVLSQIPCDNGGCNTDWTPGEYTINYLRKITSVNGNNITLDAPTVDVIDSKYAEGFLMKYTWNGKIEKVGVENLYIDSKYTNSNDENHGWHAVSFSNAKNCWVNKIEVHHFGYAAVTVNESAAWCSILNSKNIDPISQTIGGRKYSFNINGQRNLIKNCSTNGGRHDYVTGAQTAGPNTFVNCTAANQKADIGPHHRWGTGVLFDNIKGNFEQNAQNRLGYGTGHGWSGAQIMYWNCTSPTFRIHSPPNHFNWAIGCKGNVTSSGNQYTGSPCISQSTGNFIAGIQFLYERQLADRLGPIVINLPPTVSISSPQNGASFIAPASIEIRANATDADGVVSKVDFYNGSTLLGSDATAPYSFVWAGVATGSYSVTTKAFDNSGAITTSTVVNVSVTPPTPTCLPVSSSSDDGNIAANVLDNNLNTRWSASGDGQSIQFCLETIQNAYGVKIAFYNGNIRQSIFDVQLSQDGTNWSNVLSNVRSSGVSNELETFSFPTQMVKYLKIVGHGNSVNTWNSYTEVKIQTDTTPINQHPVVSITSPITTSFFAPANINLAANATDPDGTVTKVEFYNGTTLLFSDITSPYNYSWNNVAIGNYSITAKATDNLGAVTTSDIINIQVTQPLPVCSPASSSSDDGNIATNVLDNSLDTRWSSSGDGQWIQFCMNNIQNVNGIKIAFYNGNVRQSIFDVQLSQDGVNWTNALTNVRSSGISNELETFSFPSQLAKYVKIIGHGNTVNLWNSYTEVNILSGSSPLNQAPAVSLTSPITTTFNAPATIVLSANATDTDGTISKVEFFNGNSLLFVDNTLPYSYSWNNVAAGTYIIKAIATDNLGATATSTTSTIVVNQVTSNPCSTTPLYKENSGYAPGSTVQNFGAKYQCKPYPYSGWCNGSAWAYEPGVGSYWADAWILVGSCSSARISAGATSNEHVINNAPNPFTASTTIEVATEAGEVSVKVYNKAGQLVQTIFEGIQNDGTHQFTFDASGLPADIYIIKYTTANDVITRKIIKTE
jgi:hypothetical protein